MCEKLKNSTQYIETRAVRQPHPDISRAQQVFPDFCDFYGNTNCVGSFDSQSVLQQNKPVCLFTS